MSHMIQANPLGPTNGRQRRSPDGLRTRIKMLKHELGTVMQELNGAAPYEAVNHMKEIIRGLYELVRNLNEAVQYEAINNVKEITRGLYVLMRNLNEAAIKI
ncbi:unnamed protein product [Nippostrongylus brasiliensis]|uniref:Uncharacterized protein n=1 Tax=Nippostrongylus brasiliensis TaxID=27835 RepID=A0A0N4XPS6_NIPBR|nr:unnamed protein product [Nippostrongylus brasiliensis]